MPVWAQAGLWGLLAGGALVVGAAIAWFVRVPQRVVASVMAFGAGVLISALAFDLVDEAEASGGLTATALDFLAGATAYVVANVTLARHGAAHRKLPKASNPRRRSTMAQVRRSPSARFSTGYRSRSSWDRRCCPATGSPSRCSPRFSSPNLPEGLSSAAGMKRAGRSAGYVFGVWSFIAVASGVAGLLGALLLDGASAQTVASITALAAGAILAMVADTMIPEAFERTHLYAGLIATVGFILAFAIERAA